MDEYIKKSDIGLTDFEIILCKGSYKEALLMLFDKIERIPTADVRPVVLCRECKRYRGRPWENNETGICARTDSGVREDDFCSYGEKREES